MILCFTINTKKNGIRVPDLKMQGAAEFVLPDEFAGGNKPWMIIALQILRGLMAHWLHTSLFWRVCMQPMGALLSYGGELGITVLCSDLELIEAIWPTIQLLRKVAGDNELRPGL